MSDPFDIFDDYDADPTYRPGRGRSDIDYTIFAEANRANPRGRMRTKADHVARYRLIRDRFPSTTFGEAEWRAIFRFRPQVFAALCRVLIDIDAAQDERPNQGGVRRQVGAIEGHRRLLRLFGRDYSLLPFPEALRALAGGRSLAIIARRSGLQRSRVWRLLKAEIEPTGDDIESIAAGFACHPSYFIEWRTAYVMTAIADRIADSPETSMHLYRMVHS